MKVIMTKPPAAPESSDAPAASEASSASDSKGESSDGAESSLFSSFGRRLSFLRKESITIMDQVSSVTREKAAVLQEKAAVLAEAASQKYTEYMEEVAKSKAAAAASSSSDNNINTPPTSTFTIDDVDEISGLNVEDEQSSAVSSLEVDPNKISISRTDLEKAYALAMHVLAGLKAGDTLPINKDTLPGATLFPCIMYRSSVEGSEGVEAVDHVPEHRFLVVTKERFLVIDSKGGGVGSSGIVETNKHLTDVCTVCTVVCDDLCCLLVLIYYTCVASENDI
jgi:hypothetical protein